MVWFYFAAGAAVLSFGGILLFGAPYLPTLTPQVMSALELADLRPGQTLIELGSGDGKVLIAAAQSGLTVIGYELNPVLALLSWLRTRRFRGQVKVIWGNFFTADWPAADGLFTFLHPRFMQKLDKKIIQYKYKPVKLVSFAFTVPGRQPANTKKGVFLYNYL